LYRDFTYFDKYNYHYKSYSATQTKYYTTNNTAVRIGLKLRYKINKKTYFSIGIVKTRNAKQMYNKIQEHYAEYYFGVATESKLYTTTTLEKTTYEPVSYLPVSINYKFKENDLVNIAIGWNFGLENYKNSFLIGFNISLSKIY
jgi:hypothetical protein